MPRPVLQRRVRPHCLGSLWPRGEAMSLPEDATLWFAVQVETLKRVHSSWVPGVPIELLTQARKLALGRRWLAKRLYAVSPNLFGLPAEQDSAGILRFEAAAG